MSEIALTGAGGDVGRELPGAFDESDEHELRPFTLSEHDDVDGDLLDVTVPDDVTEKLAGASSPDADWETVSETNVEGTNVEGTKHVHDATVENGIGRVVFASSSHAVGTHNAADDGPERMTDGHARTVRADAEDLEVVNLRIGWYMSEGDLREVVEDADPGRSRFARALWLSPRDCRDVHRKAATADLPENPVTVNPVSRSDERFHSITGTMRVLGYEPRDDAAEVLDGGVGAYPEFERHRAGCFRPSTVGAEGRRTSNNR